MKDLTNILPYIPHGVKTELGTIVEIMRSKKEGLWFTIEKGNIEHQVQIQNIKLILHPISQLTEKIKEGGKEFVPIDELRRLSRLEGARVSYSDLSLRWDRTKNQPSIHMELNDWKIILDKLHEWHFDLYGLIESGQAISIEDLQYNPYE